MEMHQYVILGLKKKKQTDRYYNTPLFLDCQKTNSCLLKRRCQVMKKASRQTMLRAGKTCEEDVGKMEVGGSFGVVH